MLLIVLGMPLSARAVLYRKAETMPGARVVIISDTLDMHERSTELFFFIDPHEGDDYLRAKVWLFIPKDQSAEAVQKSRL